jgi:glycosyltransferase involved in cell wall biosynthesis
MKIFMNNPREDWIVDRIRGEWYRNNESTATEDINLCDTIWIAAAWQWSLIPTQLLKEKKVVCTIHHITPNKFTKESLREFLYRDGFVDAYHTPNKYTAAFVSKITKKPVYTVGYWYDHRVWNEDHLPTKLAKERLQIPEDKFVVGSFQRDTEGSDLKSPKLEKGPDLFCDYLEKIKDKDPFVLLGGWRRQYVISRLEQAQIPYKYCERVPLEELKNMYAACDLYIVSSRHEGGPQAILEATAMKVPIISTRVGVAETILCEQCIVDIPNEVYFPSQEDVDNNYRTVQEYEIKKHKATFLKMFQEVLSNA